MRDEKETAQVERSSFIPHPSSLIPALLLTAHGEKLTIIAVSTGEARRFVSRARADLLRALESKTCPPIPRTTHTHARSACARTASAQSARRAHACLRPSATCWPRSP